MVVVRVGVRHQTTDLSRTFLATFRLQYQDDYRYEFSVLSTRFKFEGRKFSKWACSELKTRTGNRPRTPILMHEGAVVRSLQARLPTQPHLIPVPVALSNRESILQLPCGWETAVPRCCLVKTPGGESLLGVNFLLNRNKTVTRQGMKSVTLRYLVNKMNTGTLAGCEA